MMYLLPCRSLQGPLGCHSSPFGRRESSNSESRLAVELNPSWREGGEACSKTFCFVAQAL